MIFAPDTEVSLLYTASLVNTRPSAAAPETLVDVDALLDQMAAWAWTGSMPTSMEDIASVRRVRDRLRTLWDVEIGEAVEVVNALLSDGQALPQLVNHEPYGWHIHATDSQSPVAVRIAVEAAMAMVDVIRTDALDRLQLCARPGCDNVLVDLSKNRSRKFCDLSCANKAHAAAYRARNTAR